MCHPAEHKNHVRSYDFVSAKTCDGRAVRVLNLIDGHKIKGSRSSS
ncbi:MAG TPA: hypothetical protein VF905_09610 [Nitrospirota bacterium]